MSQMEVKRDLAARVVDPYRVWLALDGKNHLIEEKLTMMPGEPIRIQTSWTGKDPISISQVSSLSKSTHMDLLKQISPNDRGFERERLEARLAQLVNSNVLAAGNLQELELKFKSGRHNEQDVRTAKITWKALQMRDAFIDVVLKGLQRLYDGILSSTAFRNFLLQLAWDNFQENFRVSNDIPSWMALPILPPPKMDKKENIKLEVSDPMVKTEAKTKTISFPRWIVGTFDRNGWFFWHSIPKTPSFAIMTLDEKSKELVKRLQENEPVYLHMTSFNKSDSMHLLGSPFSSSNTRSYHLEVTLINVWNTWKKTYANEYLLLSQDQETSIEPETLNYNHRVTHFYMEYLMRAINLANMDALSDQAYDDIISGKQAQVLAE